MRINIWKLHAWGSVCIYTNISLCNFISITYSYIYIFYIYNTLVRIYGGFNIYFFPRENHCALWELGVYQWSSKNVFSVCASLRIWCLQMKYKAKSEWLLELPNKGHLWSTSLSCRMHHSGCQPSPRSGFKISLCSSVASL